ncbi:MULTISPECIES: hypothetical protein [unclassified Microcoleus]|uniref:hypothetical protein n=1 Tax=unclassified Microcoleus TaxID=2642155 RepID=UPI002FD78ED3
MPTRNQTVRCIPQAVNTSSTNDPHLENLGNNYKKVDPLTIANQIRPSQPSFAPIAAELSLTATQHNHHT